jgi:hypothetical protein
VVTGAASPDICHIFPFAAKKNPDRISSGLFAYMYLWGTPVFQRLKSLLVEDGNIIDTAANMVALQPLLHRWWSKAMIGFEPIEKIEKGIRLRVRWLPKTRLAMKDKVALDMNPSDCLQPYSDQDGYVGISHSKTHRPIVSGTVIDITAQDESAVPNWDLFSLQWDLVRMASLCGAAEASDDDDWESDDDEDPQAKVARTTDDLYLDSPITASATPGFQPFRSLPVQSQESSPTKPSRESSPIKPSRESSTIHRESSPAKSGRGRVDENNPW